MIRFGKTEDISELKNLWKECFADEDAYIDAFFQALYQGEHVLAAQENGVLLGASFFLPGSINIEGSWQQIRYVYALAVYPRFRGRGIAGRLLKEAREIYQAPLIAEPAEEGLVGGFYRPLGFSEAFYLKKRQIKMQQYDLQAAQVQTGMEIYPADAAAYCRIRDRHFLKHGYVSWPKEHVAFAIAQHKENGGDAFIVAREGREDILLYYVEDGQAVVIETTLDGQEAAEVLNITLRQSCSTVLLTGEVVLAGESLMQGDVTKETAGELRILGSDDCYLTGVSLGMTGVRGYLNITLD